MYAYGMYYPMSYYTSNQYNFYAARQHPWESFSQFAMRLRVLASTCNFPDMEEELHYRFVMGMLPGRERTQLFTVELSQPLTFAKAVEFVEGVHYTSGATSEWVTPPVTACERPPEEVAKERLYTKPLPIYHFTNRVIPRVKGLAPRNRLQPRPRLNTHFR